MKRIISRTEVKKLKLLKKIDQFFKEKDFKKCQSYCIKFLDGYSNDELNSDIRLIYFSTLFQEKKYTQVVESEYKPEFISIDLFDIIYKSLIKINQLKEAIEFIENHDGILPFDFEVYFHLGNCYLELNENHLAIRSFKKSLELKPDNSIALNNAGTAFRAMGMYKDAAQCFYLGFNLDPRDTDLAANLGSALISLGKFEEGKGVLLQSINSRDPISGAVFYANALLSEGNFQEGLGYYHQRVKLDRAPYNCGKNLVLTSNDITNDCIILPEQGIGDNIFFMRFLKEFVDRQNILVNLAIDDRLANLIGNSFSSNFRIIGEKEYKKEFKKFKNYLPIGEFCRFFMEQDYKFDLVEPLFKVSNTSIEETKRLISKDKKFTIGISWLSKNRVSGITRSISLDRIFSILSDKDIRVVSLQYGDDDLDFTARAKKFNIDATSANFVDKFNDIDGLSALLRACDCIISVDNSTAHLAGAIGANTNLLLPVDAHWFWLQNLPKVPWYPSINIFRQKNILDWEPVLHDLKRYIFN
jgi:Tetratricopeptide repeat